MPLMGPGGSLVVRPHAHTSQRHRSNCPGQSGTGRSEEGLSAMPHLGHRRARHVSCSFSLARRVTDNTHDGTARTCRPCSGKCRNVRKSILVAILRSREKLGGGAHQRRSWWKSLKLRRRRRRHRRRHQCACWVATIDSQPCSVEKVQHMYRMIDGRARFQQVPKIITAK
jgi:hypothetical protein